MTRNPIRKIVTVSQTPMGAFTIFSRDLSLWWPQTGSANVSHAPSSLSLEPELGGAITETRADGSIAKWGTITDWTPGHRLSVDWYLDRDETAVTTVSVTFTQGIGGKQVDLVHDGFESLSTPDATQRWTGTWAQKTAA